jgi:hypothetical protein
LKSLNLKRLKMKTRMKLTIAMTMKTNIAPSWRPRPLLQGEGMKDDGMGAGEHRFRFLRLGHPVEHAYRPTAGQDVVPCLVGVGPSRA